MDSQDIGAAAGLAMLGLIFLSLIVYCVYEYRNGRRQERLIS